MARAKSSRSKKAAAELETTPLAAPEQPPGGQPPAGPPDVPPGLAKKAQLTMEYSVYASPEFVASQAAQVFVLAGGGQELPPTAAAELYVEGRLIGFPPPLPGFEPPPPVPPTMPPTEELELEQRAAEGDPAIGGTDELVPRIGYPGIRIEDEPPPRSPPAEPFPVDQPEGP